MPARHAAYLFAVLVLTPASASPAPIAGVVEVRTPRLATRDLLADRMWDDGEAEYSVYQGTITRYGKSRPLHARIIVVKEDMDVAQRVKSERGPIRGKTRTVIKQNYSHDFATGTYDYHQMCSTFLDREEGWLHKLAMSSIEGCGITYVEILADFNPDASKWRRRSHSYWDGEGDRNETVRAGALHVAADALPLWLRRLRLDARQSFDVSFFASQLSNRVGPFVPLRAHIEVVGRADRHGLPVTFRQERPSTGQGAPRVDRYWFDAAWPHGLTRYESGGEDATVLERVKMMRVAYWQKTAPGDERLLAP